MTIYRTVLPVLYSAIVLAACTGEPAQEVRDDFKQHYDQFKVEGSFALYDARADKYILYNQPQFDEMFSPASTFKICNTLIGLETGVVPDADYVIPWDSVTRNPVWDKDYDLRGAFQYSVVWYYQEVARRIGGERMKTWLDKAGYGNADTLGGIDQFWLSGGLRISPRQQIEFLRKLHDGQLPFSPRSMGIVQDIMVVQDTLGYVLRAKSGWGGHGAKDVGWFVGYLERGSDVYYFANCVQIESDRLNDLETAISFDNSRARITENILRSMDLMGQ